MRAPLLKHRSPAARNWTKLQHFFVYCRYQPVMVLLTCAAILATIIAVALLAYSVFSLKGLLERSLSAARAARSEVVTAYSSANATLSGDGGQGDKRTVSLASFMFIGAMTALLLVSWGVYLYFVIASQVRELEDGTTCE